MLAYPLAASVPLIAGSLQLYTYLDQGTLCTKGLVIIFHYKLDMFFDTDKIFSTDTRTERNEMLHDKYLYLHFFTSFTVDYEMMHLLADG